MRELAHSLREACGQVFRHGNSIGACEHNPAPALGQALKPVATKHMAAVLEPAAAGQLMRSILAYEGQPSTRAALELSALVFQRPGNIRALEWAWVDLDAAMITIPAAEMKRNKAGKVNGRPHFVPMAPRTVDIREFSRWVNQQGAFTGSPWVLWDDTSRSRIAGSGT